MVFASDRGLSLSAHKLFAVQSKNVVKEKTSQECLKRELKCVARKVVKNKRVMKSDENCNRAKSFLGSPDSPLVCLLFYYAEAQFSVDQSMLYV